MFLMARDFFATVVDAVSGSGGARNIRPYTADGDFRYPGFSERAGFRAAMALHPMGFKAYGPKIKAGRGAQPHPAQPVRIDELRNYASKYQAQQGLTVS